MPAIGEYNQLTITENSLHGMYLDGGEYGPILLPHRYVPMNAAIGSEVEVFLYRDSEDRLIATTEKPLAMVDEFAFLKVVDYKPNVGAFLDLGLAKHLLLPRREQRGNVRIGDRVVVYIGLDPMTDRLVASMRIDEYLNPTPPRYEEGQPVNLLIYSETPLGYKAIIENAHDGLLYHNDLNARLTVGQRLRGFVNTVRPDGKIDLKLDPAGYQRIGPLAEEILTKLRAHQGRLELDDSSPPEAIRHTFGVSKKAFKQAIGLLLRQKRIRFAKGGIELTGDAKP